MNTEYCACVCSRPVFRLKWINHSEDLLCDPNKDGCLRSSGTEETAAVKVSHMISAARHFMSVILCVVMCQMGLREASVAPRLLHSGAELLSQLHNVTRSTTCFLSETFPVLCFHCCWQHQSEDNEDKKQWHFSVSIFNKLCCAIYI